MSPGVKSTTGLKQSSYRRRERFVYRPSRRGTLGLAPWPDGFLIHSGVEGDLLATKRVCCFRLHNSDLGKSFDDRERRNNTDARMCNGISE